jgi:hypothetical protein
MFPAGCLIMSWSDLESSLDGACSDFQSISEELGPADPEDLSCGSPVMPEMSGNHEDYILYRGAGHHSGDFKTS